ncbi:MAG: PAS domain S-box protein [Alphaproteobacteria bacterium]
MGEKPKGLDDTGLNPASDLGSQLFSDLLRILAFSVVGASVLIYFDASEAFYEFSRAHEAWELDEIITALVFLGITAAFVVLRRLLIIRQQHEKHQIARELQRSEERLKGVNRIGQLGYWDWDMVSNEISWSEGAFKILGYDKSAVKPTQTALIDVIHPDDLEMAVEAVRLAAEEPPGVFASDHRIMRPDGRLRYIHVEGEFTFDDSGDPVHLAGIIQDITERYQYQERIRSMTEDAPVGILIMTQKGTIEDANPAANRMFGYEPGVLVGQSAFDLAAGSHRAELLDAFSGYLDGSEPRYIGQGPQEVMGLRSDGTEFPVDLVVSDTKKAGGDWRFVLITLDVSDLRTAREQLRQAQKMEAVGQLTGGVAHDFNNLLMALQMNLELLQSRIGEDRESSEHLQSSLRSIERGAKLTHRLLAFSRDQILEPETADLNEIVDSMTSLLRRTLGETIEVKTNLSDALWPTLVDPSQLESAILNLAINARHAMPDGGTLEIETRNIEIHEPTTWGDDTIDSGDFVRLSVADTGTGMSPEVMNRVFEPFFTTKEVGKGSGLGLSMIYGFIKQSEGHIEVDSAEGKGTTFRLYLPRVVEAVKATESVRGRAGSLPGGDETILLVEDDEAVRKSLIRMLQLLGYDVHAAADGPAALRLVDDPEFRPQLVLSDVVLPGGLKGPQVVEAVMARVDGCRALLMSGYTERQSGGEPGFSDPGIELIHKPYTREVLARKIRDVIAG